MSIFQTFIKNCTDIFTHPTSVATLIGLLIIIIVLMRVKHIKITTKMLTQIGIALALATILKVFRLYHLTNGGSITLGSMVPILLIAFIYGPETGFLTGLLYGLITLILDPYILHPTQVLFDYPLPFMALGIAGYFRSNKYLGTILAVLGRFICHFISGVAFFGSFAPDGMSPALYSLTVNGIFIGIEGAICFIIIALLPITLLTKIALNGQVSNFNS
ncbi:energy-coupled thiamine transporter ThiT [Haloimpatiens sp. FM7315]|uniref:energy-coupled thiamine transporter ThiT n=1 Tax=Haloimpatiens sp. FM7315 TaxID=3298609 RepID=UPI0035A39459